jgi:hypothetical protein
MLIKMIYVTVTTENNETDHHGPPFYFCFQEHTTKLPDAAACSSPQE